MPEIKVTPVVPVEDVYTKRVMVEMTEAQWIAFRHYAKYYSNNAFAPLAAAKLAGSYSLPDNWYESQERL